MLSKLVLAKFPWIGGAEGWNSESYSPYSWWLNQTLIVNNSLRNSGVLCIFFSRQTIMGMRSIWQSVQSPNPLPAAPLLPALGGYLKNVNASLFWFLGFFFFSGRYVWRGPGRILVVLSLIDPGKEKGWSGNT